MMAVRDLADAHVVIVGMGLMGASLGYDLRGHVRRVTGVVRRTEAVVATAQAGCVDEATTDALTAAAQADILILATPVRTILHQIPQLGAVMKPGALLMDMGSTKSDICRALATLPEPIQPIGGHPMCGKETSGLEAAEPGLYRGCTFVLCPLPRTSDHALSLAQALVHHIQARPLILEPQRHDQLVAAISHLPYLVASGLMRHVMGVAATDPLVWDVAASGFRDTTRVAASDVAMLMDILLTNQEAVLAAVDDFMAQMVDLRDWVAASDEAALRQALEAVAQARRDWGKSRPTH